MSDCQHRLLGDIQIARCEQHSTEHVAMWSWSATTPEEQGLCPCEVADRYVVATEHAPANWLACADVLLADPRPSVEDARLATFPKKVGIVVIPVEGRETVFRTDADNWVDPKMCAACVYPVLFTAGVR